MQPAAEKIPHILVVDDSPLNLNTVCLLLERIGCRASGAASGEQALQLLREQPVDLVLMDCMMPDMDGYEATRRIRNGDSTSAIPVVALSARIDPACRALCREVGMDDFIEKPINRQRLVAVLKRWFELNE
ncbi:MAG: response regulator [Geobacter sp.]|nr:response regulator [Geobacter sp.]